MSNCHKEIQLFHDEHVAVSEQDMKAMFESRDLLREWMESKLTKLNISLPSEYISQGSVTMDTVVKGHPKNKKKFDIDEGIVFPDDFFLGGMSGKTGLQIRNYIYRALKKDSVNDELVNCMKRDKHCIRFCFEHHDIDIPIYRNSTNSDIDSPYELASTGEFFKDADPEGVTKWFNKTVEKKNPDDSGQMRRIVRLLKYFVKSRKVTEGVSGLIVSVLVAECYQARPDREDIALFETMESILDRLNKTLKVTHPVVKHPKEENMEELLADDGDSCMQKLKKSLEKRMKELSKVYGETDCQNKEKTLHTWNKVFRHKCFIQS